MTLPLRDTTAWRGRRPSWGNTSSGQGLLQLSRATCAAVLVSPSDPLLPEIREAQAGDAAIFASINTLLWGPGGESNPALPGGSPSGKLVGDLQLREGILYHQGRILIPPTSTSLILTILRQYHDSLVAGHYGVARTQALVGQYFQWAGLATAVEGYVRSCARVTVGPPSSGDQGGPWGGRGHLSAHQHTTLGAWRGVKPRTARWQPIGQVSRGSIASEGHSLPSRTHPHPAYSNSPHPQHSPPVP